MNIEIEKLPGMAQMAENFQHTCKRCQEPIRFVRTYKGTRIPVDMNGTAHFCDGFELVYKNGRKT